MVGTTPTAATEAIAGEGGEAEAGAEAAIETETGAVAIAIGTGTAVGAGVAIEAAIAGTTDGENVREAETAGIERVVHRRGDAKSGMSCDPAAPKYSLLRVARSLVHEYPRRVHVLQRIEGIAARSRVNLHPKP